MTETGLFIIAAVIAVAAAVTMFITENAVYSALCLIVVMGCIAFFFILLEAPFLAMIQITVYAGAIMVLFVFVIMLLGAERVRAAASKFRLLSPPFVVGLAALFLIITSVFLLGGSIDLQQPPGAQPLVRVINAATDAGAVDVYANDTLITSGLPFYRASAFVSVPDGEYRITLNPANGEPVTSTILLHQNSVQTIVAYGTQDSGVSLSVVPQDLSTTDGKTARVTVFNGFSEAARVNLVDLGVNGQFDGDTDRVILSDFEPGTVSDTLLEPEGAVNWAFIAPNGDVLVRMRDLEFSRNTSQVVVLTGERISVQDTVRALARPAPSFVSRALPSFGGPEAIGIDLFTRYLLPFELVSLLLLVSMVGAIILTHKEEARVKDRAARRRRVSRPLASVVAAQVGHDVTQPGGETPRLPAENPQAAGD